MKRLTVLLIAVVLVATFSTCAYGEEGTSFTTNLLKAIDFDAKKWMSNESNRAAFAACSLLDYTVQEDIPYDISQMFFGTVYVGRAGLTLITGYNAPNNSESLYILYMPGVSDANYIVFPYNKSVLEYSMEKICSDGYYKVDSVDLKQSIELIGSAIQ